MSNFPSRLAVGVALACDLVAAIPLAPSSAPGAHYDQEDTRAKRAWRP